ncbi:MAG: shikimate dehydrogenase [gamma proteobacterium symbiont of Bathyaustriella thionipta]|nr:shikimate dehydrogenase [gamma proteobacterium symbiont of Bathyaustriella thionipta]MCU7950940.1 shikimate dehydrogenase [gamma proteobacterium symbiont of Bathyaustriella thionipta]MCU7953162.1 shikimate dehydrogenase [gamma proteobacterium symbiont of Bathyaustriella thionipta]MCU7957431.1 shikimate dehydrogenase [gamma proteobacterium symbiont of Bathyaustriella thionipta]MCU7968927.1 shikimate dehydrogenase [gamma proteobacterium symbiont of Bathyaustriella thionipta]
MSDIFDFDKPALYAVMGNPINHSKSPQIHTAFALQTDQKLEYSAIHVDVGGFAQAVSHFQGHGGKGLNVTVPFKLDAWKLSDTLTERAKTAGAVNTLILTDEGLIEGDNTDGVGLVNDIIEHLGWTIAQKKVLILGAGGASRGVIGPILEQKPYSLTIANRTAVKATELASLFTDIKSTDTHPVTGGGYDSLNGKQFDLVINATAASLKGEVPPLPDELVSSEGCCYDMMYAARPTAFMEWASQHGVSNISDGLGMLVGQAAESFNIWRGVKPEVKEVIDSIRNSM